MILVSTAVLMVVLFVCLLLLFLLLLRVEQFTIIGHIIVVTADFQTTCEDVLVCDLVLMALLTLFFFSLSTELVVFVVCYVSLQFLD